MDRFLLSSHLWYVTNHKISTLHLPQVHVVFGKKTPPNSILLHSYQSIYLHPVHITRLNFALYKGVEEFF